MPSLAAFAASDAGLVYAKVCERWHVDPGAVFHDDVLAYNARVAFSHCLAQAERKQEQMADVQTYPDGHTVVTGLDPFSG